MNTPDCATPYMFPTTHRALQLQAQQLPPTRCHPTQSFIHVGCKPPFALDLPSLDLTGQVMVSSSHPFHLGFNDNLLRTTPSRVASSCQPLPSDLGLQHYLPTVDNGERCTGTSDQNPMNSWPPLSTRVGRPPGMITSRPWPKASGLTPEVFLPGGDTQHYSNFLLEPRDGNPSFSPDGDAFNHVALPTPMPTADTPRLREQPRDLVVSLSGSESDSGQEQDDERNMFRDRHQDQWTSISMPSPRDESPAMTLSRRSSSFLATEETKLRPSLPAKDIECPTRTTRRARSSSRKPKMHQCLTCKKWFPRPSGLATHMNVHSGAKPFTCPVQSCNKKFAVRSNAKRHLRTHGIMPTPDMSFISTPAAEDNDVAAAPDTPSWIPQTLKERNLTLDDLEICPLLISELPLARPSTYVWDGEMVYEERDSFAEAPIAPYHPAYWRCLPGPAPTTAAACISSAS